MSTAAFAVAPALREARRASRLAQLEAAAATLRAVEGVASCYALINSIGVVTDAEDGGTGLRPKDAVALLTAAGFTAGRVTTTGFGRFTVEVLV